MKAIFHTLVLSLLLPAVTLAQQVQEQPPEGYQDERRETPEHQHPESHSHHHPRQHHRLYQDDEERAPESKENEVSGHSLLDDNDFPLPHMMDADPFWKVMIDELEWRDGDGDDLYAWNMEAWWGGDLNRVWFKSEAEYEDSRFETLELQLLYSRAISPFWNLQAGLRHDSDPQSREWLALAVEGLAPYWFETEASLFLGEGGQAELRLEAEYELLLTQRLILTPEIEVSVFADDEPALGIGSGLSKGEFGLRLRYEIRRQFAPYVGLQYERAFGDTGDLKKAAGEDEDDLAVLAGLRIWF